MARRRRRAFLVVSLAAMAASCGGPRSPRAAAPATTYPGSNGLSAPSTGAAPTTTAAPRGQVDADEPVTIVFAGDIHYDGALAGRLARNPDTMLSAVQPLLSSADLAVVNLETAIGTGGDTATKAFNFRAPPSAFDALAASGVDVIGMANNHALDYGQAGLRETLAAIAERHAPVIGVGVDEEAAYRPFTATVKGQRIAVIAATQIIDSNLIADWTAGPDHPGVASAKRVDRLVAAVAEARPNADIVAVFLHWGTETVTCPNAAQLALASKLVEAGADLVIGGHAHRVLGGGYLGHAFVEYGLGNFQFIASSPPGRESGLLRVTMRRHHVDRDEWLPVRIGADSLPVPLSGAEATAALRRWLDRRPCTKLADEPSTAEPGSDR